MLVKAGAFVDTANDAEETALSMLAKAPPTFHKQALESARYLINVAGADPAYPTFVCLCVCVCVCVCACASARVKQRMTSIVPPPLVPVPCRPLPLLCEAASANFPDMIRFLVTECNLDPHDTTPNDCAPIHYAACAGAVPFSPDGHRCAAFVGSGV